MRPTPTELADGIRLLLRKAGAEMHGERTKAQMRRVMSVLKGVRWDNAAFDLLHENEIFSAGLEAFGATPAPATTPRSFTEANAQNLALRTALRAELDRLRDKPPAASADARRQLTLRLLERP